MAGLANNNNPFQSQVRIGPNYIQLVPGPPGPAGSIGSISGSGLVHVTSGSVDNAAYLGAAGAIPIVNAGGTDTAWLGIGTAGQVLTVVGGAPTWAAAPSGVTWANDLSSSTNLAQWVSGISGSGGTGGSVSVGDGIHSITFFGVGSSVASPPQILIQGSQGLAGNSGGGVGILAGPGGTSSGVGGGAFMLSGQGGTAAAGNNTGGAGGLTTIAGGHGGVSTGTAANVNGGNVLIFGGLPGSGGSGAAAHYGDVLLSNATTKAFVTENPAGPGFGIGTTPGTDPTITRGTGVPGTTQPNGSVFLRTDATTASNALYARVAAAWLALGGTTTTSATLTFEGQAFQIAAAGSGNGAILWPVGQATPTITQTILASDVTPANIAITAQSAQPGAATHLTGGNLVLTSGAGATTNGTPGNVIANVPPATGAGSEGGFSVQRSGTSLATLGTLSGSTTYGFIWLGGATGYNSNNYVLASNALSDTYLRSATTLHMGIGTALEFEINSAGIQMFGAGTFGLGGGTSVIGITNATTVPTSAPTNGIIAWANTGSPGSLGLFATGVQFHRLAGAITISQDAPTSDVATSALTIQAQTAYTGASTNINGASITLKGGNSATGGVDAKGGDVLISGGDTLSGATAANGAKVTLQSGIGTSPGDIAFNMGGYKVASFSSTPNVVTNAQFLWEDGVINGPAFNFGFRNKTADTTPQPCAISGQNAWSSASTNTTGGSGAVYGGTGVGGVGAGQVIANGGGTATNAGQIWLIAPSGVGVSSGNTLHWMSASPAISATGTTTLSSSQYNCPFLHFTGTITGAVTVAFPNVAGFWLVDLSAMTGYSPSNTISFNCGSTTKVVVNSATVLSGTDTLVVVVTNGSNTIYLLGSTVTAI